MSKLTIHDALKLGVKAHKLGRLQEAKSYYTAIIKAAPDHADANHNMGVLDVGLGKLNEALPFFEKAIKANSSVEQYWVSFVDALCELGQVSIAKNLIKKAKSQGLSEELIERLEELLVVTDNKDTPHPPQESINQLVHLYNKGQLATVVEHAQGLIEQYPNAFFVWNLLGAANKGLARNYEASEAFKKVTELNPNYADGHNNMGAALKDLGKVEEAIEACNKALAIRPNYAEAFNNIGNALQNQGKLEQAIEAYNKALIIKPEYAEAHYNIGNAFQNQGKLERAIKAYNKALAIRPEYAAVFYNMGISFQDQGKLKEAIRAYNKALAIKPEYAEAYYNMGNTLKDQGKLEEAIAAYRKALAIKPNYAEAFNNIGNALQAQGELEEAIDAYYKLLAIEPDNDKAFNNIGNALQEQRKPEKAIEAYYKALTIKPDNAEAFYNIGLTFKQQGKLIEAIEACKKALSIKPDYAEAYYNMGLTFQDLGKLEEAIEAYNKALFLKPDYSEARAQKMYRQAHICDWRAIEGECALLTDLGILGHSLPPFTVLSLEDAPEQHRIRSENYAKDKFTIKSIVLPQRPSQIPERLRIGYFSSDFKEHPVAYLLAKVIEYHDRSLFKVFGYSLAPPKMDAMRERLTSSFDVFRDVHNLSDAEILKVAHEDAIDIAIDLTGYTQNSRSKIFSYRPAPVQINFLGYPGTMGANFMDYIIADKNLIPQDFQKFYSEAQIYLPHQYQPQDDELKISARTPTRSNLGLPEKGFVFCAINNTYKITPREFDIWMLLLHRVEGSVLWLLESNKWAKANLLKEALARGVPGERLVFAKKVAHENYLAQFKQADLYLDTFNYNAGATASNALWAGLPVLTKQGKSYTARMASSLLIALGLPELITTSEIEYQKLALKLAQNPEQLAFLAQKLIINRASKPLFKTALFTKKIEQGYKMAYQKFFNGEAPETIIVPE